MSTSVKTSLAKKRLKEETWGTCEPRNGREGSFLHRDVMFNMAGEPTGPL